MDTKHTPGKWTAGDTIDREHVRALRAHGIDRCDCDGCKRMLRDAAPDLLAALRECEAMLDKAYDRAPAMGTAQREYEKAMRIARAAIAKATGEK